MNINNISIKLVASITLYFFFTINTLSQTMEQIRLLDHDTYSPIQGVTFEYGEQRGISDENGLISFSTSEDLTMKLSHVSYGKWRWSYIEVLNVTRQNIYYCKRLTTNLYPVTIIALRPNQVPSEKISLEYQNRMAHDGASILNQMPALNSIRKSGNYGFDPVFRGFKYDQLNIVLNGSQSATAACPNRMDPPTSQMAPNMMDRIEVIKGPHALRYGTGFGGTINFVPSKLRFTNELSVYGRLSAGFESNGKVLRSEGQIGLSGKVYDLSLFGAWSQGNDYEAGNGQAVQADFQRGSFGANLGLKLSRNQQLRVSALYNLARDADFQALPMDLRGDDTWMFNAQHNININKGSLKSWNTTMFASFVGHMMDNLLKPLDPRVLNAKTLATTYNYGGRTEGVWRFAKGALYAGADLRIEGAEGTRVREFLSGPNMGNTFQDNAWQDSRISKTGLFGEYHLNTEKTQFVFSGRVELNVANINDPSDAFTQMYGEAKETQLNPSLSVGVTRRVYKSIKMGVWLGRAQRSGGLTERFINYFPVGQDPFEMLGNPQILPEVNNQVDLTFEWATEKTALNIDVFASYLQDFISSVIDKTISPILPMSPGVRQFINIDKAFKTGFEVNWIRDLAIGLQHQIGIAYTYAQDLNRNESLPEIAPLDFRYTLRGSYFDKKLQPEATFRYVLEQSRISTEFGETVTPSFYLLDVQVSYQFSNTLRLSAGINNLFNENYFEHLSRSVRGANNPIFARGRNIHASLNINF